MTESHRYLIQQFFPDLQAPIHLLREFMPESVDNQVSDPFGMNLNVYEGCRDSIVEAIPSVLQYLRTEIRPLLLKKK